MRAADPDARLVAKSNAGMPELVDMRAVYRADPETMAAAALTMRDAGASIIGGCCGNTPDHLARDRGARRGLTGRARMSEWIYFIHPPREDFAATMTQAERDVWGAHFERFERMLADGSLILVGPTLGRTNTGYRDLRGARRGRRAPDHGGGPGHRRWLRPGRTAGLSASRCCGAAPADQTGSWNWMTASRFPSGSLNQAARPGPIVAIPSTVAGRLVRLEDDAAGAQVGDLGVDVVDGERHLGVVPADGLPARESAKSAARRRSIEDRAGSLGEGREAEDVLVEAAGARSTSSVGSVVCARRSASIVEPPVSGEPTAASVGSEPLRYGGHDRHHPEPRHALPHATPAAQLRATDAGATARLAGWVHRRRDHGQLIFLDLRDRHGITQVVIDKTDAPEAHARRSRVRTEFVVTVEGTVAPRLPGTENAKLPTGAIELRATTVDDPVARRRRRRSTSTSRTRRSTRASACKYRYLDIRREPMQRRLILRSRMVQAIREVHHANGFVEVETPTLIKSTPEGARDFIVPSRLQPGTVYALPQSPQQLKQLLMVAGIDRYFQIARCYRDEDLRGDRQPEFTQLDLEMSFVDEDDRDGLRRGDGDRGLAGRPCPSGRSLQMPFPR